MTISSAWGLAERLRILRLVTARAGLKLCASFARLFLPISQWGSRPPERLLIAPQDIRPGDPTIAADIYAGYYAFGGKIVTAHGRSPFEIAAPSEEWARILIRLQLAPAFALGRHCLGPRQRQISGKGIHCPVGPHFDSSRLGDRASWLDERFPGSANPPCCWRARITTNIGASCAFFPAAIGSCGEKRETSLAGEVQLTAAIAMTAFALCIQGGANLLKRAVATLNGQLNKQILLDGGPIGRNPQTLVDLLFDLLPLRQAFAARGLSPPPDLLNAIDRMTPALRMFRHGDGSLALFNGTGVTAPERIAIVLSYEDARGQPMFNARYSGYQRLEGGDALVLVDAGPPPPPLFSHAGHAGCLSFEFSLGAERIVVNCGSPGPQRADLCAMARTTAAHSTLIVDDASSCLFSRQAGVRGWFDDEILSGPKHVPVTRTDDEREMTVVASHDGYHKRFGLIHERKLTLQTHGGRLEGLDRLTAEREIGAKETRYAIRFHIHPSVALTSIWEGLGVLLQTANGVALTFEAGGLPVVVEESIFFAATDGPRSCEQIVIHGVNPDINEIHWSFSLEAPCADGENE